MKKKQPKPLSAIKGSKPTSKKPAQKRKPHPGLTVRG